MTTFEPIGGGLSVAVNDYCHVSQDGILLSRFAAPLPTDTAIDLGTGNGLIPLCWCRRDPPQTIIAVERDPDFAALAKASIARHNLSDRIELRVADWNDIDDVKADVITCNPPFFAFGASRVPEDPKKAAARHEDSPDMLDRLFQAAARMLTARGKFCICHRPDRIFDLMKAAETASLTVRRLQFVQVNAQAQPWLVLCEAAKRGSLQILPTVIVSEQGDHTAVYKRLYGAKTL